MQRDFDSRHRITKALAHVIPEYMGHNDSVVGMQVGREEIRKRFDDIPFNPTKNIARIKLPSQGVFDYSRAYLLVTASCAQVGGTYVRFPLGFWNIITQIRILDGGKELLNWRDVNLLYSIQYEIARQTTIDSTFAPSLYGVANQATRNAWAVGHDYIVALNVDLLTSKVLDYTMLKNALELEITFEQPARLLETDGVTYTYLVSSMDLILEQLKKVPSSYRRGLRSLNAIHYIVDEYHPYRTTFTGANINFTIPHVSQSIVGLMILMRDNTTLADPTVNDKFNTYNYNNAQELRLKLNEEFLTEEPMPLTGQCLRGYMQLFKFLGHWEAQGVYGDVMALSSQQWLNNKFVLCWDMEDHPHLWKHYINEREAHPDSNFTLEMRLAAPPAVQQELLIWILTKAVVIKRQGYLNVVR